MITQGMPKSRKIKAIVANPVKEWQTRREMQNQPTEMDKCYETAFKKDFGGRVPRYHVGEIVYIKEAFTYVTLAEKDPWKDRAMKDGSFRRKPDGSPVSMCYKLDGYEIGSDWLNPRVMPAWASRYFIEVTKVEAGRTKDITWTDCVDEGIKAFGMDGNVAGRGYWSWDGDLMFNTPQLAYFALYDSINGKGAHERNWDWKYSFIKVDKPNFHTLPNLEKELKSE